MRKITTVLTATFIFLASLALAHEGHKHVMGKVATVAADHLQVKTKDGKAVTVPLAKTTRYLKGKVKATAADIHVGDRVVVDLEKSGAAEEVRLTAGKMDAMDHSSMDHSSMDHGSMDHGTSTKPAVIAQVNDPVCGMKVADPKTAPKSVYAGKTYYFCSKEDKAKFDKAPSSYLKKSS